MISRRHILLGATALSLTAACASAPDAPATPATYSAAAFFQTTAYRMGAPTGHGFSSDGRSILISNDANGVFNAYALSIEGGAAVPLTASTTNATFADSYFPNDERVIVSADQGGNELNHVYVRERDGALRDLTPGEELKAEFLSWRDDGAAFYLISNERNPEVFDLYEYDAASYQRRLVYENPGMQITAIAGNGRWLAMVAPTHQRRQRHLSCELACARHARAAPDHRAHRQHLARSA